MKKHGNAFYLRISNVTCDSISIFITVLCAHNSKAYRPPEEFRLQAAYHLLCIWQLESFSNGVLPAGKFPITIKWPQSVILLHFLVRCNFTVVTFLRSSYRFTVCSSRVFCLSGTVLVSGSMHSFFPSHLRHLLWVCLQCILACEMCLRNCVLTFVPAISQNSMTLSQVSTQRFLGRQTFSFSAVHCLLAVLFVWKPLFEVRGIFMAFGIRWRVPSIVPAVIFKGR